MAVVVDASLYVQLSLSSCSSGCVFSFITYYKDATVICKERLRLRRLHRAKSNPWWLSWKQYIRLDRRYVGDLIDQKHNRQLAKAALHRLYNEELSIMRDIWDDLVKEWEDTEWHSRKFMEDLIAREEREQDEDETWEEREFLDRFEDYDDGVTYDPILDELMFDSSY